MPQSVSERAAVKLSANVQPSPARVQLNWKAISGTSSIAIYRKLQGGSSWGNAIANPSASAISYIDQAVSNGVAYEYKVVRVSNGVTGTGYLSSGIKVPMVDYRGKMILLVDNTLASGLVQELQTLENDLIGDGWSVVRSDISPSANVQSVRATVIAHYNSDPTNVKAVYIVGHVPVPYSGNIAPDGHGSHQGAWPCDGYYGELNGTWTDTNVSVQASQNPKNFNTPGDGKFDQSDFPSALELQVGRVDMNDLPAFGTSELELLRSYLNKAHSFKVKEWTPNNRAIIFDNLQWVGNPLAASGWRSIPTMVGSEEISAPYQYGPSYNSIVNGQSYLWAYASGGGLQTVTDGVATFNGAENIATTQIYAASNSGGVFNMSFGSYFGDWDNKNNFLRAPLARGEGLTNAFSSIPGWYFHHMGLGANIGYSTLQTMNNTGNYVPLTDGWQGTIGRTHLGLMGDPSLRQKMVAPASGLTITNSGGNAYFSWTASNQPVAGYYLYEINTGTGVITKVVGQLLTGTSYLSSIPFQYGKKYMVRAMYEQIDPSGSYENLALGAIGFSGGTTPPQSSDCAGVVGGNATVGSACNDNNPCTINDKYNANCQCVGVDNSPNGTLVAGGVTDFCNGGSVILNAATGSGYSYSWKKNGVTINGANNYYYTANTTGVFRVIVSSSSCSVTSNAINVNTSSGPAATITTPNGTSFCAGGSVLLQANTGLGYQYIWYKNGVVISGQISSSYTATSAGAYSVRVISAACYTNSSTVNITVGSSGTATITPAGPTSFCTGGSVVLSASSGSNYVWKKNGSTISGATSSTYTATSSGTYTVTVGSGTCTATSSGVVVESSGSIPANITAPNGTTLCGGGSLVLQANTGSGYQYVWYKNGSVINGATTSSYTVTQTGGYAVRVISGTCYSTSSTMNITVSTSLVAALVANGPTAFCSGGSVALQASTGVGYTYVWKRNNSVIQGETGSSLLALTGGTYTATITSGTCTSTTNGITLNIGISPIATMTVVQQGSICSSAGVGLSVPYYPNYTYIWRKNGVTINGATSSTYIATSTGGYEVSIINEGCVSNSDIVFINASGNVMTWVMANGPTTVCSGNTVPLSAVTGTGYSYVWRKNGSTIAGATSASFNATQSGSYSVRVSANGCTMNSSSIQVTVTTPMVISTSANPSNGTVTATVVGGQAPYAYEWNTSPLQNTATASIIENGTYGVVVLDALGCKAAASVFYASSGTSDGGANGNANCTDIRTEKENVWGAFPTAANPAGYMHSHFATSFPNGLTIGCATRTLHLANAGAVTDFLPSSGLCAVLPTGVLTNPNWNYGNLFAGELVALKLTVAFDQVDANFSEATGLIRDLVVASGQFVGWTVQAVIDECDMTIGGCASNYSVNELNATITAINDGYQGGNMNSGILMCPSGMMVDATNEEVQEIELTTKVVDTSSIVENVNCSAYPNPFRGSTTFAVTGLDPEQHTSLDVYSAGGVLVDQVFAGKADVSGALQLTWQTNSLKSGMYFYRLISGDQVINGKLIAE